MLTVKEINEVSFGKAGFSGYKPEDVDNFIDQVAASFQELIGERDAAVKQVGELAALNTDLAGRNADAQKKLSILAQKVESYRQEEEGIKEAIISAQRMSKELVNEAQGKADSIIQAAHAEAEAKLLEANEQARKITANAQEDASKAAREYAKQAETKKNELEEIKRQVTAFRSSLLEMYKKHLECIDHIPVFRQKEDRPAPVPAEPEPIPQPKPVTEEPQESQFQVYEPPVVHEPKHEASTEPVMAAPQPDPVVEAAPQQKSEPGYVETPTPRRGRQPVIEQPVIEETPASEPMPERTSRQRQESAHQARTLNDRVNYAQESYVQEQLRPSAPPEVFLGENDLSSVGIDLSATSNIPDALIQAKKNNYSGLFNDDAVQDDRRRRR